MIHIYNYSIAHIHTHHIYIHILMHVPPSSMRVLQESTLSTSLLIIKLPVVEIKFTSYT